jgi:hypothetical protein
VIGKRKDISIAQVNLSIKYDNIKYLKTWPPIPPPPPKENYITLSDKKKQTYSNISSNKNTVNKTE